MPQASSLWTSTFWRFGPVGPRTPWPQCCYCSNYRGGSRPSLAAGSAACHKSKLMTTSVLDILIYVFDRYMLEDTSEVPERDDLARDLELLGFGSASVERALDWLADLADVRQHCAEAPARESVSLRVYSDGELTRLSTESRGFLMHLERHGILSPVQREVVLDRLLALDSDELDTEQIKWVVLMVLSSQPGQEQAFARMEDLVADTTGYPPH